MSDNMINEWIKWTNRIVEGPKTTWLAQNPSIILVGQGHIDEILGMTQIPNAPMAIDLKFQFKINWQFHFLANSQ